MIRDRIDEAIDATASRMTAVKLDDGLSGRITEALPDRRIGLSWIVSGWAPRLAVVALVAGAAALWSVRTDVRTDVQTTARPDVQRAVQKTVQETVQTEVQTTVQTNDRPNARPNDRLNDRMNVRLNVPDHEFSLAAITAPEPLAVGVLGPSDLAADDTLAIAPLVIDDLPLSTDFSPR